MTDPTTPSQPQNPSTASQPAVSPITTRTTTTASTATTPPAPVVPTPTPNPAAPAPTAPNPPTTVTTRMQTRQQQHTTPPTLPTQQTQTVAPTPTHVPIFPSATTLPQPSGKISAILTAIPQNTQITNAETFLSILQAPSPDFRQLNHPSPIQTALLLIPNTSDVKLVFNISFGCTTPNIPSPLSDKMLCLFGEGDELIGVPDPLLFDKAILETSRDCLCPSTTDTQTELNTQRASLGPFLLAPRNVNSTKKVFACAPCPFFLIPDGMHKDLKAAEVLERAWTHLPQTSPMTKHLQNFLQAALTGPLRQSDTKPFAPLPEWQARIPPQAKVWTKSQCSQLFPSIFPAQSPPTQHQPQLSIPPHVQAHAQQTNSTQPAPQLLTTGTAPPAASFPAQFPPGLPPLPSGQLSEAFVLQMMQLLQSSQNKQAASSFVEEKKDDDTLTTKVSDRETTLMKILCGQDPTSDNVVLPDWYQKLFQKNMTDVDRDYIVGDILNAGTPRFQQEKIRGYPELKKMIRKRDWAGGENGCEPSFAFACYGLTVFALLDLTEDEAAQMRFDDELRIGATAVTPSDLQKVSRKLVATIPECGLKWRGGILKLTNLLQNLFTPECCLYVKLVQLCKVILNMYSEETIRCLSEHAKAAIYWIIHLQCRHFAQGKMRPGLPELELLPAFSYMFNLICSGQIHVVTFAALPARLLKPSTSLSSKRKLGEGLGDTMGDALDERLAKLLKREKDMEKKLGNKDVDHSNDRTRDPWNSILEAKLLPALKQAKFPSLGRICKYCNISQERVMSNMKKGDCRNFIVLGRCKWGPKRCKMDHQTATDEQATEVIEKLEQFITAPDGVTGM